MVLVPRDAFLRALPRAALAAGLIILAGCDRGPPIPTGNDIAADGGIGEGAAMIRARQSHFRDMEAQSQAIDRALAGQAPTLPVIRENAQRLADYAPQILTWFPAGSDAGAGAATNAKAEIWRDQEDFGRAAFDLIAAAEEFSIIARGGDVAAIRAARPALTAACTGCHARFLVGGDAG